MEEQILNAISQLLIDRVQIGEQYHNTAYHSDFLFDEELAELEGIESLYERQLRLKEIVAEHLQGSFEDHETNRWIVHRWGGIPNFQLDNQRNDHRIMQFGQDLYEDHPVALSSIASLSKIASFVNPEMWFIYDSRVAVALNGLIIMCYEQDHNQNPVFFPMPPSRGNGRSDIMMNIIGEYFPNAVFLNEAETYFEYCNVVRELYARVFPNDRQPRPFKVEMLLFMLGKTPRGNDLQNNFLIENHFHMPERRRQMRGIQVVDDHRLLRLRVYDGTRIDNYGKTLQISRKVSNQMANRVVLEYHNIEYEANLVTYNSDKKTLRRAGSIDAFIRDNNLPPGSEAICRFEPIDGIHRYIVAVGDSFEMME